MKLNNEFDTIILGSGIAGATMASILSKQGFRTLLLEKNSHPRFAIGESMLPQASMWMWIVGKRYGIPEITRLCNSNVVCQEVSASCGVKRSVGFVYHKEGEPQQKNETYQIIPPEGLFISESHLFRQDVDHYMLQTAVKYGAVYRDHTEVNQIDFDDEGVSVSTADGESYRARFLLDGTGFRSLIAKQFNLREQPTRLKTRSRAIFTHLAGLQPYDTCTTPGQGHQWHEGTLHHMFDGGWLWIIPFNNHTGANNQLCSVGLMLDPDKFPKSDLSPEQEFREIVARYPSIAKHLEGSHAVQPWISTGQTQYSSTQAVGDRWALLSHSYGFIDALYSRGLISTFETINALAGRLISALQEDDFAVERFDYVDQLQKTQLDATDKLIHNAYRAMSDFELSNAWTQFWLAGKVLGDTYLFRTCLKYMTTGDPALFAQLEEDPYPGAAAPYAAGLKQLIDRASSLLDQVDAGTLTSAEAAQQMLALLRESDLLPQSVYAWGDPDARYINFNNFFKGWLHWGKSESPAFLRENLFDFQLAEAAFVA